MKFQTLLMYEKRVIVAGDVAYIFETLGRLNLAL